MKLTQKTLKTISIILTGLSLFALGFTFAYGWKKNLPGGANLGLVVIVLALLAGFFANAAKRKKDQESNGD